MRKPTPAWPLFALELSFMWPFCRLVKHSSRLLTSPMPITSLTNLVSLSSSSSSCICSFLSRVLTLHVAIVSLLIYLLLFRFDAEILSSPCK